MPKKIKKIKVQGIENKPYIEAMRNLRRSNAAGLHADTSNRERSRNDALRAAVKRSRGEG
jgi:hypothetical protein